MSNNPKPVTDNFADQLQALKTFRDWVDWIDSLFLIPFPYALISPSTLPNTTRVPVAMVNDRSGGTCWLLPSAENTVHVSALRFFKPQIVLFVGCCTTCAVGVAN